MRLVLLVGAVVGENLSSSMRGHNVGRRAANFGVIKAPAKARAVLGEGDRGVRERVGLMRISTKKQRNVCEERKGTQLIDRE